MQTVEFVTNVSFFIIKVFMGPMLAPFMQVYPYLCRFVGLTGLKWRLHCHISPRVEMDSLRSGYNGRPGSRSKRTVFAGVVSTRCPCVQGSRAATQDEELGHPREAGGS